MEAAEKATCRSVDNFNPLITTIFQVSCILVISHMFHILLKPLGQPGPFAQLLAGVVVGPTLLSRIRRVEDFFIQASSAEYYMFFSFLCRMLFMFSIGLETDIPYLKRNIRVVSIVAGGGIILSSICAAPLLWLLIKVFTVTKSRFPFYLLIFTVLANSASPVAAWLYSSLISEMSCVAFVATLTACSSTIRLVGAIIATLVTVLLIFLNNYLPFVFNKRNRHNRFLTNSELFLIIFILLAISLLVESAGYTAITCCFLAGLMFPREGKTCRTLLHKLTYAVNTFVLPIYFGYTGFQFNISKIFNKLTLILTVLIILLSAGTKIVATLAACNYDLIIINSPPVPKMLWENDIHDLFLSVVVLKTLILAPVVAIWLNRGEFCAHYPTTLEILNPESELRMMACAYIPRHVSGYLSLISALSGCPNATLNPYVAHLVELRKKKKSKLMYHQLEDGDQYSDEEEYGGNDVVQITNALDSFISETKIPVHEAKIVSSFLTINQDVCNGAVDLRVSIIFLPFHKHQRVDGKMENSMEGIRTINQKVIRHAPCSVGIFLDRGQTGFQQPHGSLSVQNIATFFFGGPDDREALACSKRILMHSQVSLTVFRFIQANSSIQNSWISDASHKDEEVVMAILSIGTENEMDNFFVDSFYNRYVAQGKASLIEKYVSDGAETLVALREILDNMYSLVIVGKGGRENSSLTIGMSDWEECPELGLVGDLLASSEMNFSGSLLVIQQHRHSEEDEAFITP
ncbi:hypothetical protein ES332_D11G083400v1 [Gossypium tomentosum]|uniref:Uncharacterized protein n=1 Tax=Gossypium tomentosum TaxID=34277 RepID=A0A5D2IJT1_GOSTO|nr:hypothetical protein ES332_D11G083400v1 [Gossypium tomentosum]